MMRRQQIEARVLDIVEAVTSKRKVEDDRVELKAKWPIDYRRTARQLAGHANQAGGEDLIWVIGLDEQNHAVTGASDTELSSWWPRIARCFDELAPEISNLVVPTPGGSQVHALVFDTSRAPYMVLNDTSRGAPEREVPWRSSNGTRSARRSELLRAVVDQALTPQLECIRATVFFNHATNNRGQRVDEDDLAGAFEVVLSMDFYIEATAECTFPEHRWQCSATVGAVDVDLTESLTIRGPTRSLGNGSSGFGVGASSSTFVPVGSIEYVVNSGLHVFGNEAAAARSRVELAKPELAEHLRNRRRIQLRLELPLANSSRTSRLDLNLYRHKADEAQRMFYAPAAWFSAENRGRYY